MVIAARLPRSNYLPFAASYGRNRAGNQSRATRMLTMLAHEIEHGEASNTHTSLNTIVLHSTTDLLHHLPTGRSVHFGPCCLHDNLLERESNDLNEYAIICCFLRPVRPFDGLI